MKEFVTYINEAVAKLQVEEQQLAASDRKDEANLVKIRINIYGICMTIFNVVAKGKELSSESGDSLKLCQEQYLRKLAALPQNWRESYEKAKTHNDVEKIVIEEIKLETLEEIKRKFVELCNQ